MDNAGRPQKDRVPPLNCTVRLYVAEGRSEPGPVVVVHSPKAAAAVGAPEQPRLAASPSGQGVTKAAAARLPVALPPAAAAAVRRKSGVGGLKPAATKGTAVPGDEVPSLSERGQSIVAFAKANREKWLEWLQACPIGAKKKKKDPQLHSEAALELFLASCST